MNIDQIADRLEEILSSVINAASQSNPAPDDYLMLFDRSKSDFWFVGFLFRNWEAHRDALENGTCFWLHNYTSSLLESSDLKDLDRYIVFDAGSLPQDAEQQRAAYTKYHERLNSLNQEGKSAVISSCNLCGHGANEHEMRGFPAEDSEAPTEGWMICPEKDCSCFRTWSVNGG